MKPLSQNCKIILLLVWLSASINTQNFKDSNRATLIHIKCEDDDMYQGNFQN